MKQNKGITLVSLMIYLIALSIIIGIASTFIRYFYRNSDDAETTSNNYGMYSRLTTYLAEETNSGNVDYITVNNEKNTLTIYLKTKQIHQYNYDSSSNKVYYITWDNELNKEVQLILCENVTSCEFTQDNENNKKFTLELKTGDITYKNIFIAF